jgi:hypothetical protein
MMLHEKISVWALEMPEIKHDKEPADEAREHTAVGERIRGYSLDSVESARYLWR